MTDPDPETLIATYSRSDVERTVMSNEATRVIALPDTSSVAPHPRWGEDGPRVIQLPIVHDVRGNLTVVEGRIHIPFDIMRTYYLYDVPGGSSRGGHGHRKLEQLIIAMSGSFDVLIDDGSRRERFQLNRSYIGLYVPPMMWREIDNFSSGAVCMVLASERYDEGDYYRDYATFQKDALQQR